MPETTTCEASCVGAALGIVWDINDPTTQWPPATSDLVLAPTISEVSSDVPPTNKRKYPVTSVTEEPVRNSERKKKRFQNTLMMDLIPLFHSSLH